MTSILPTIKVTDVPENRANKLTGLAIVGYVDQREVANGYVQVVVPLHFYNGSQQPTAADLARASDTVLGGYDNGTLDETLANVGLHTFVARWNVRPEWFDPNYAAAIKAGQVSENEAIQYRINMSNLTRGLFKAAGTDTIDFTTLPGKVVGFSTRNRKDDPSRLDIASFYAPKK